MAAFGTRVTTTTQDKIVPKVVDLVLNSNILASRVLSKAAKWNGETNEVPSKTRKEHYRYIILQVLIHSQLQQLTTE
jgi:hypothetical protein